MLRTNKQLKTTKRKSSLIFMMMATCLQTIFLFFQPASAQTQTIRENDVRRLGGEAFLRMLKDKNQGGLKIKKANVIARNSSPGNAVVQVGDQPENFGKTFIWDRKDDEILLVMFINAADSYGTSILGVQDCDEIQITSAAGIASFSEDKGNPTASSLVGLIGTGLKAAGGIVGFPEAIPVINAAEKIAQEEFKATNVKTKRRDAYGVDPGTGHKARQEGGLVVSLPRAAQPYYSGDGDHTERWIKGDGERKDLNRPNHVKWGYFPMPTNTIFNNARRTVRGSNAPLYITPWDWQFDDNAGFYKVFLYIKKANSTCKEW